MTDYNNMSEQELRDFQASKNKELVKLRSAGKGSEARALREEILRIQAAGDAKQQERYAQYERTAAETPEAQSTSIEAIASAAVTEAERILGG